MKLSAAVLMPALIVACASSPPYAILVADVENVSSNQLVGYWYGSGLDLTNAESSGSIVTLQGSTLPMSRADIQQTLDWLDELDTVSCSDGSAFDYAPRHGEAINVQPLESDLILVTPESRGVDRFTYFDRADIGFVCTRSEAREVTVAITS